MARLMIATLAVVGAAAISTTARADPCEAPLPPAGATFSGQVRYVGDGDSLCVGDSANPDRWIEVRLADFYAPELKDPGGERAAAALRRVGKGRHAECLAEGRSYDRVVAYCTIGGVPIGDLMRAQGIAEGGRGR